MPAPNVEFHRIAITVRNRPIADAQGRPISFPPDASGAPVTFPLRIGATIYHWAAPRPADGWAAIAYALLHDVRTINELSASHDTTAQYGYLQRICEAFRNYYNCLNIVWFNDPIARACYRKWIAGPPHLINGDSKLSIFKNEKNYGGDYGWYIPNYEPALLFSERTPSVLYRGAIPISINPSDGSRPPAGVIPRLTRTLFDRFYPYSSTAVYHRVLYVPTLGFSLRVAPGTETPYQLGLTGDTSFRSLSVEVSDDVMNDFWLTFESRSGCPEGVNAFPVLCELNPSVEGAGAAFTHDVLPVSGGPRSIGPDGHFTNRDDWFNFRFLQATTEINPNVDLPAGVGPAEYIPWLREWIDAVILRTAEDAILDSRAFVVYQNYEMVRQAGTTARLLQALSAANSDIVAQQTHPDPTIESAAQAAFAIGGALATATYGISALVGGAIGAGLMVADAAWIHPVEGHGKDDLGRWKPVFDRAWLSGDATTDDPLRGAPHYSVPAPPSSTPNANGTRSIGFIGFVGVTAPGSRPKDTIEIPPPVTSPPSGTPGYVGGVQGGGGGKSRWPWLAAGALAFGAAWKFLRK